MRLRAATKTRQPPLTAATRSIHSEHLCIRTPTDTHPCNSTPSRRYPGSLDNDDVELQKFGPKVTNISIAPREESITLVLEALDIRLMMDLSPELQGEAIISPVQDDGVE